MTRAGLAAFLSFHATQNPTAPPVVQLTDGDALELLREVDVETLRHPSEVEAGVAALELVPAPPTDHDALEAWALTKRDASRQLWDGLAGEEIDGVTIIRKRT